VLRSATTASARATLATANGPNAVASSGPAARLGKERRRNNVLVGMALLPVDSLTTRPPERATHDVALFDVVRGDRWLPHSRTTGILIGPRASDSDFSSGIREGKSRSVGDLAARVTDRQPDSHV
jgi:hypothetical protein